MAPYVGGQYQGLLSILSLKICIIFFSAESSGMNCLKLGNDRVIQSSVARSFLDPAVSRTSSKPLMIECILSASERHEQMVRRVVAR